MACLHEKTGSQKGDDLRPFHQAGQGAGRLPHRGPPRVRDGQAAEPDSRVEHEYQFRNDVGTGPLDHGAEREHGEDEADRAPESNGGIAPSPGPEVIEGDHLDLRQGCMPEEAEQGHHQGDAPKPIHREHPEEGE